MLVVGVDENEGVLQEIIQFTLGLLDTFERAEPLQVCATDVGDEPAGRFHGFYQCLDITGVGCAHLDNGNLVFGFQAEQSLRNAHVVIEIAWV